MRIDPKTLLFHDLTPDDARSMLAWARQVVLQGHLPPDPPWVAPWMTIAKYDDSQRLLVLSLILPLRALLSVLETNEPAETKPLTLESLLSVLDRAGVRDDVPLMERVHQFATSWFSRFDHADTPAADVELVREASRFCNENGRWPWEPQKLP